MVLLTSFLNFSSMFGRIIRCSTVESLDDVIFYRNTSATLPVDEGMSSMVTFKMIFSPWVARIRHWQMSPWNTKKVFQFHFNTFINCGWKKYAFLRSQTIKLVSKTKSCCQISISIKDEIKGRTIKLRNLYGTFGIYSLTQTTSSEK